MRYYFAFCARLVLPILAVTLLALPCPTHAVELTMDFKDADIHTVIAYVSEATKTNVVVDPSVKGRITVYSPTKLGREEALATFAAILEVHGYSMIRQGSTYRIVPTKDGVGQSVGAGLGMTLPLSESVRGTLVTQILRLKVGVAAELAKTLPPLLGKDYAISSYAPTNTLAITAPYENVTKALAFIAQVEAGEGVGKAITLPLTHGDAKTLAVSLSRMLKSRDDDLGKKGRFSASQVVADERTNSLMVYGDSEAVEMVRATVARLDIPTPKGKGDVHILNLSNAKAEEVSAVINALVERQTSGSVEGEEKQMVLSSNLKVVADKATNSLVITARPDEFEALRGIVSKMDIRRRQVFIEALIMEVSSDSSFAFGINWAVGGKVGQDAVAIGGVNLGGGAIGLDTTTRTVGLPAGMSIGGIFRNVFSVGGTSYNIQSIINAVKDNSDVDILATPQLLTLDNEEASVEVVDNVPYTKETTTRNDADFTTQAMDYKDVGVKLKITPRISDNGSMRLEVEQEVSRVTQGIITLANGNQLVAPTTRKRAVKSTILMQDSQTAVIAGLLSDNTTHNQSKVPGLGDVPLFGWLFKSKKKVSAQTNLFIFITPKVIHSTDDMDAITNDKKMVLHETNVGKDGLGRPIMSKPVLAPVYGG